MHDPLTVAFDIRYPWRAYRNRPAPNEFLRTYRNSFITIWHKDPNRRGNDNSCDWHGQHRPLKPKEQALYDAIDDLLHTLGNRPFYPDQRLYGKDPHAIGGDGEHVDRGPIGALEKARYQWCLRSRFRIPPRWHVWHWRFQIHPLQDFKRWAFTRCADCGGRFKFGESGWTNQWDSGGPRWFRGERDLHHMNCGQHGQPVAEAA